MSCSSMKSQTRRSTHSHNEESDDSALKSQTRRSTHSHNEESEDSVLNQLETDIRSADAMKSLHAEIAGQEATHWAEKIQNKIAHQMVTYGNEDFFKEGDRKHAHTKAVQMADLKRGLESQIMDKQFEKRHQDKEDRKERQGLIEMDKVSEAEDHVKKILKKEEIADRLITRNLIQKEIKDVHDQKYQEQEHLYIDANKKYTEEIRKREKDLENSKKLTAQAREDAVVKVATMLMNLEDEVSERKQAVIDMLVEGVKRDLYLDHREGELKRKREMKDLTQVWEEQIEFEEECKKRFVEREKLFADMIMRKIMESEDMERTTDQLKWRRRIDYREELERLMERRSAARDEELRKMKLALEAERKRDEAFEKKAKADKKRMFEEHVGNIAEHMSRKLLSDEEKELLKLYS